MKSIILLLYILLILNKGMNPRETPQLPKKLKIGYASWHECDEKIFEAVKNGLNVVIWFSINMSSNSDGTKPEFTGGPDYAEVAKMIKRFKDSNYQVINLISIGGWNSPHVNVAFTAEEYLEEWIEFNKRITKPEYDFYGFDGIDWDIEGNDDFNSSINHFTFKELDLMGTFSQIMKKEGYIVSMAPSESYLDPTTEEFSLSLLFNHPEWEKEVPDFNYHGRNAYSYLLAKYSVDTFDFISVQLYEGYSHSLYKYKREKKDFGIILYDLINSFTEGYTVDFSTEKDSGMGKEVITIPREKIVIGLANAWAGGGRFLFVDEKYIVEGWNYIKQNNKDVRGIMFWDIADEGKIPNEEDAFHIRPFYMAKILNALL